MRNKSNRHVPADGVISVLISPILGKNHASIIILPASDIDPWVLVTLSAEQVDDLISELTAARVELGTSPDSQ